MWSDNNKRKNSSTSSEISFKPEDDTVSAGTTKLSKEEMQLLFQGRNLAFLATLSKDGSPYTLRQ